MNAGHVEEKYEQPTKSIKKEEEDASVSQRDTNKDISQNIAAEKNKKDFPI